MSSQKSPSSKIPSASDKESGGSRSDDSELITEHKFQPGDTIEQAFTCQLCGAGDEEHGQRSTHEEVCHDLLHELLSTIGDLGHYRRDNYEYTQTWKADVKARWEKRIKEAKR